MGMKEVNFILILVTFAVADAEDFSAALYDRPYDSLVETGGRKVENMLDRQASLSAIRSLVNDLEGRMMKRTSSYGMPCLGAGMSHNCEFNDLKETLKHIEQISSGHFPGRRKRFLLDGVDGSAE